MAIIGFLWCNEWWVIFDLMQCECSVIPIGCWQFFWTTNSNRALAMSEKSQNNEHSWENAQIFLNNLYLQGRFWLLRWGNVWLPELLNILVSCNALYFYLKMTIMKLETRIKNSSQLEKNTWKNMMNCLIPFHRLSNTCVRSLSVISDDRARPLEQPAGFV